MLIVWQSIHGKEIIPSYHIKRSRAQSITQVINLKAQIFYETLSKWGHCRKLIETVFEVDEYRFEVWKSDDKIQKPCGCICCRLLHTNMGEISNGCWPFQWVIFLIACGNVCEWFSCWTQFEDMLPKLNVPSYFLKCIVMCKVDHGGTYLNIFFISSIWYP